MLIIVFIPKELLGGLVERQKNEHSVAITESIQWRVNAVLGKKQQRLNILSKLHYNIYIYIWSVFNII